VPPARSRCSRRSCGLLVEVLDDELTDDIGLAQARFLLNPLDLLMKMPGKDDCEYPHKCFPLG
jgi:hypothetical protein